MLDLVWGDPGCGLTEDQCAAVNVDDGEVGDDPLHHCSPGERQRALVEDLGAAIAIGVLADAHERLDLDQRRNSDRNNHRSTFSAAETSSIDVIGTYIRVLPLLIRISPGRFPSQDRAPVQARSPPTSSSSPPPTSHGPQSLVTDLHAWYLRSDCRRVAAVGPHPRGTSAGGLPFAVGT